MLAGNHEQQSDKQLLHKTVRDSRNNEIFTKAQLEQNRSSLTYKEKDLERFMTNQSSTIP
jgi:hypothetical protein